MIILVLADVPSAAAALTVELRGAGREVLGPVGTIAEVAELGERWRPDLALIDINLRGADGLEAAELLFRRCGCVPLFVNGRPDRAGKYPVWGRLGLGSSEPDVETRPRATLRAAEAERRSRRPRNDRARSLEGELRRVRLDLQATIAKLEAANGELQAFNEEATAVAEELQVANEELEVSRDELATGYDRLRETIEQLTRTSDHLSNLLSSVQTVTIFLDPELRIRWFAPGTTRVVPLLSDDVGRPIQSFTFQVRDPRLFRDAAAVLTQPLPIERDVPGEGGRWYVRRVLPYRTREGRVDGVVLTFDDITERKQAEARAQHLALHDALTGLPNRVLFHDRLGRAAALAKRTGTRAGLVLIDLDDFKGVNDEFGHPAGDRLLREVAERLGAVARKSDTLARLGGDEFAFVQNQVRRPGDVMAAAGKLVGALSAPFDLDGHTVQVSASAGAVLFPSGDAEASELLRRADVALYRAKSDGRGQVRFFERSLDAKLHAQRRLEFDLRAALERKDLFLHYQPRLELASNRFNGVEALARWRHARLGLVPPSQFVPIAEASGLIRPLGEWVLHEACRQARAWIDLGHELRMAVNLSPAQVRLDRLLPTVDGALAAHGLEGRHLELEITEGLLLDTSAPAIDLLRSLAERGIELAVDDFGTGYSSLAYLKRLPVRQIKIDRSFVAGIGRNGESEALVRAITTLGHELGKRVVGEGVETEAQLDFLRGIGCDEAQGFFLCRPLLAQALDPVLARRTIG